MRRPAALTYRTPMSFSLSTQPTLSNPRASARPGIWLGGPGSGCARKSRALPNVGTLAKSYSRIWYPTHRPEIEPARTWAAGSKTGLLTRREVSGDRGTTVAGRADHAVVAVRRPVPECPPWRAHPL